MKNMRMIGYRVVGFLLVALASWNADAVNVTINDNCGGTLSGAGAISSADSSGNLVISNSSGAYQALYGCGAQAPVTPACSLSASQVTLAPGGTATLFAHCTSNPTAFSWTAPPNSPANPTGASSTMTFSAAGAYTYSVIASNASGLGSPSNQLTVLVADASQPPICTLTASPVSVTPSGTAKLSATCYPSATSYVWSADPGAPAAPSGSVGSITFPTPGVFSYRVQGVNAAGAGPVASAAITVPGSTNVALASMGSMAFASTIQDQPVAAVNNGDETGAGYQEGGVWMDATDGVFPDWVEIDFAASYPIDTVILFSPQDDYMNPVPPTDTMTFTNLGSVDFNVQGWSGTAWATLATVTGNNLVKRKVTFPAFTTSKIRVVVNRTLTTRTRIAEIEALSAGTNVALATAGAVAAASSSLSYPASAINDGDHVGANFGQGTVWGDGTNAYPDWAQIVFPASKTVDHIVLYSMQDNYPSPVEPTDTMTFTTYGLTDFDVQGWNGSGWTTLASVRGNNLVKRTVNFSPYATRSIRIFILRTPTIRSRIVELEVCGH